MSVHFSDNKERILTIAKNSYSIGNFRLYIMIFERFPNLFYDLGTNEYHDHLLNLLTACLLTNEKNKEIFQKVQMESLWDNRVYEL